MSTRPKIKRYLEEFEKVLDSRTDILTKFEKHCENIIQELLEEKKSKLKMEILHCLFGIQSDDEVSNAIEECNTELIEKADFLNEKNKNEYKELIEKAMNLENKNRKEKIEYLRGQFYPTR